MSLILTWSENCVIKGKATRDAVAVQGNNPEIPPINNPQVQHLK